MASDKDSLFEKPSKGRKKISRPAKTRRAWNLATPLFWKHWGEHYIRDENDYQRHLDYLHYNPVKHEYVKRVVDWPYSSFHRWVKKGVYPREWGIGYVDDNLNVGETFGA
jgi:hypothetical protein